MGLAITSALVFALPDSSIATEYLSIENDIGTARDFSQIVIAGADAQSGRLFVDPIRNVSPSENLELYPLVIGSLKDKIQIASEKEFANYLVQIIMERHYIYAIRNTIGEPAHGFVLASICKYPIKDISNDCENLTYHYFREYENSDILSQVLRKWVPTIFPSSTK